MPLSICDTNRRKPTQTVDGKNLGDRPYGLAFSPAQIEQTEQKPNWPCRQTRLSDPDTNSPDASLYTDLFCG